MFRFVKFIARIFSKSFKFLVLLGIIIFLFDMHTRLSNIEERFGGWEKLRCNQEDVKRLLNQKVVRIIGSYSEGSGFPIYSHEILTNFHVIEGEPSPKVVFPDGVIKIPKEIKANKKRDIAVLIMEDEIDSMHYGTWKEGEYILPNIDFGEPVYAAGYPLGSIIPGDVTVLKGAYSGKKYSKNTNLNYIQTDIGLVEGMSGGPLVDACGRVIGINTMGIGGLSMFIDLSDLKGSDNELSSEALAIIEIDTGSPEGTVKAFYTYIKARDLKKAFELLSGARKSTISSFEEWTKGYSQTLHVNVIAVKADEENENKVLIKIESQDWVEGDMVYKYFEGYWIVADEGGDIKLNGSNIKEVSEPSWEWFYTDES